MFGGCDAEHISAYLSSDSAPTDLEPNTFGFTTSLCWSERGDQKMNGAGQGCDCTVSERLRRRLA
jgi:hypothetical protein